MMGHRQDQPYGKRSRLLTLPSKHRNTIFVRLSQPEREVYDQLLEVAPPLCLFFYPDVCGCVGVWVLWAYKYFF